MQEIFSSLNGSAVSVVQHNLDVLDINAPMIIDISSSVERRTV
jgi:hypothetical protein